MPTRINGNLGVLEDVSPFRVNFMRLFGGFLHLSEEKPPHKKFWLKASVVAHLQHITAEELKAQREARLQAEQQAAEVSLKRQRDMDAKRQAEAAAATAKNKGKPQPERIIPSRDFHKQ